MEERYDDSDVFHTPTTMTPKQEHVEESRSDTPRTSHIPAELFPRFPANSPPQSSPIEPQSGRQVLDLDSISLKLEGAGSRRSSPRLQAERPSHNSSGETTIGPNMSRKTGPGDTGDSALRQINISGNAVPDKKNGGAVEESLQKDSKLFSKGNEVAIKQEASVVIKQESDVKKDTKKKQRKRKDSEDDIGALMSKLSIEETSGIKANKDSKTALVYDLDMTLHKNMFTTHPERPKRVTEPMKLLEESKILSRVRTVCSREVTKEEALTVHTSAHWDFLTTLPHLGNRDLHRLASEHDSLYLNNQSFRAAKLSAGCLLAVTEEVLSDRAVNGVAVIRPPGHHCLADRAMGFCLLGNVPIACKYAINNFGVQRILVVDWDVHHGNGTQDMFYQDKEVLYVSLHRYDHGTYYPGTGHPQFVGAAAGLGYNVNIGWNEWKKGDGDYLRAFYDIVLPIAMEYQPQITFISAGFDSGLGDPLGQCRVSSEGYGMMTHHLMSVSRGKVIVALEGGYNLTTVSTGIKACTSVLLGDHPESVEPEESIPSPRERGREERRREEETEHGDDGDRGGGGDRGGRARTVGSAIESIETAAKHLCHHWESLARYRDSTDQDTAKVIRKNKNQDDEKLYTLSEALKCLDSSLAGTDSCEPIPSTSDNKSELDSENVSNPEQHIPSGSTSQAATPPPTMSPTHREKDLQTSPALHSATPNECTAQDLTREDRFMTEWASRSNAKEPVKLSDELYAVQPKTWCEHLADHLTPAPPSLLAAPPCSLCQDSTESWYCLHCYQSGCSRYVNEHSLLHAVEEHHLLSLSMSDLSVWCYGCDSYVHNEVLLDAKNKAHIAKFGEPVLDLAIQ